MKTLYQYTIKTDGEKTVLTELGKKSPIAVDFRDAEQKPVVAAGLLRDLARWAIEQAEIIEELEGIRPMPQREPFGEYAAKIVEVGA